MELVQVSVLLTPLPYVYVVTKGFRFIKHLKDSLVSIADKILLRKRALIETVNDELKSIAQIEHFRHRSFSSFMANSLSAIAAYCFLERKPDIEVKFINDGQLAIF